MSFRFIPTLLVAVVLLLAPPGRADLEGDVKQVLADRDLARGEVGVTILRLGKTPADSKTLFGYNATKPLIPASNLKLVTTSAAMKILGPDFQFRTILATRNADVAVIGDGDPTLGDLELYRTFNWSIDQVFKAWAQSLADAGVKEIRDLIVDDSIFDTVTMHENWPARNQANRFAAQVGGLNFNANVLGFAVRQGPTPGSVAYTLLPATEYAKIRVTAKWGTEQKPALTRDLGTNNVTLGGEFKSATEQFITIHDPPLFAATVLAETLRAQGITITGRVRRDRTVRALVTSPDAQGWRVVTTLSTGMTPVLARTNKDSENLYAEALCKRIGAKVTGKPGTWKSGTAAAGEFLKSLGVAADQFTLDDGSGLSRNNRISTFALGKVLEADFHSAYCD